MSQFWSKAKSLMESVSRSMEWLGENLDTLGDTELREVLAFNIRLPLENYKLGTKAQRILDSRTEVRAAVVSLGPDQRLGFVSAQVDRKSGEYKVTGRADLVRKVSETMGWPYSLDSHNDLFMRIYNGIRTSKQIWEAAAEAIAGPKPDGKAEVNAWKSEAFEIIGSCPRSSR